MCVAVSRGASLFSDVDQDVSFGWYVFPCDVCGDDSASLCEVDLVSFGDAVELLCSLMDFVCWIGVDNGF